TISSKAARTLTCGSGLSLNGLKAISDSVAEELGKGELDFLSLDGLESLSSIAASHLKRTCGVLSLDGVTSLSDEVARILKDHEGDLYLQSLRTLSKEPSWKMSDSAARISTSTP
ncbi:MAG: hypothetical protein EBZ36_18155, partial [Acidobacteria bacterium]|nr:hypothetical protein [Acidobacteriota bacterium]